MDIKLNKYSCCDFYNVDSIGVLCRGKSLGCIGKYKENFKNNFVVGQHYKSFQIMGEHLMGSNIVKIHGSTFNKPSRGYKKQYEKWNIRDMQTYLTPSLSDRKAYKFKKITKRNKGYLQVYPLPENFKTRNEGYNANGKLNHPTIGLFAVDLAAAYKPKEVHIAGLDFYQAPYLAIEKMHISVASNKKRAEGMMNYFKYICKKEKDIKFYLYTCCRTIKSHKNLKVIEV